MNTYSQVKSGKELFVTVRTVEFLKADVHFDVFVQVCTLSKLFTASFIRADKWSFTSVHAQVIEEVVPLTESLITVLTTLAILRSAHKYFNHTFSHGVLCLEHKEVSRLRHILQVLDHTVQLFKVNFRARSDFNHDRFCSRNETRENSVLDRLAIDLRQKFFHNAPTHNYGLKRNFNSGLNVIETIINMLSSSLTFSCFKRYAFSRNAFLFDLMHVIFIISFPPELNVLQHRIIQSFNRIANGQVVLHLI